MRELLLPLGAGLTGQQLNELPSLGEGSINFYVDEEGYLTNYAGRTDFFVRIGFPAPPQLGSPPSTGTPITRVLTFRDVRGKEHVVFVQGAELREVVGNGFRVLYTFSGVTYEDGKYFPALFLHESKLVIVNFGDPVLLWDGLKGVHPLGVQETPLPPEPWVGRAPWTDNGAPGFGISKAYGPWQYKCYWWPGDPLYSGPSDNLDKTGAARVAGLYEIVVQFFDEYGNHGPVSPASKTIKVGAYKVVSSPALVPANEYSDSPEWKNYEFLMVDYYPPLTEDHIVGVRIGRTLSLNSDGGAGERGVYFTNTVIFDTTTGRSTLRMSDGTLAAQTAIDTVVHGPPQASMGCSFRRRVVLAGLEDPYLVAISDTELFGQFRTEYRARDHVRQVMTIGDRLLVVTRSSTEVLYEDNNGDIVILEQDFANGSLYGRSFVDVGGAAFGLMNRGFAFYDGSKFEFVEAPYFVQGAYLDERFHVYSATKWGDRYILSVRKDLTTDANNFLLVYDLRLRRWFLLEESVYDVTVWQDALLGCDNSLYELFKGPFENPCKAVLKGLIPSDGSPLAQRNLLETRILMEPSSVDAFTLEVEGEFTTAPAANGVMHSIPSKQAASRQDFPQTYWSPKFPYTLDPEWSVPGDVWITARVEKQVSGFRHTLTLEFPERHQVRLRALGLTFGDDARGGVT